MFYRTKKISRSLRSEIFESRSTLYDETVVAHRCYSKTVKKGKCALGYHQLTDSGTDDHHRHLA